MSLLLNPVTLLLYCKVICRFNPYSLADRFSHHYQLDEFTFILGMLGVILGMLGVILIFLSDFSMKFLCANRIASDGTPRSAASHLGLFCLPLSHKRDAKGFYLPYLYIETY